jgi:hypothetical protein
VNPPQQPPSLLVPQVISPVDVISPHNSHLISRNIVERTWKVDDDPYTSLCKKHLNWPRYFWVVLFQKIVEASCAAEAKADSIVIPREKTTKFESALQGAYETRKLRRVQIQTRKRVLSSTINRDDWVRCINEEENGVGGRGGGEGRNEEDATTTMVMIYPFHVLFTPSPCYQLLNAVLDKRARIAFATSISASSHIVRSLSPTSRFFFATKWSPHVSPIPRTRSTNRFIVSNKVIPSESEPLELTRKRVTRNELVCIILALIEHHPDLKTLRGNPVLISRYCDAVIASLFASAGGSCGQSLLQSIVVKEGGIGDTLWHAARTHLHKLPAFSRSEFKLLNTSFDLAAKASNREDIVDSQLSSALSLGVWSRIKVSFSRAVTRFSRLDRITEIPTTPRSPPFTGYDGLIHSQTIADPDPSSDDSAYVTLPHFLRFFKPDITRLALERAFAGRGRALDSGVPGRMAFSDICALLAANMWGMKGDAATIEYWLRCCDIDDDGMLSFEDAVSCIEAKALHARWEKLQDQADTTNAIAVLKDLWPRNRFTLLGGRMPLSGRDIEREKMGGPLFRLIVSLTETGLCEGKKE